mmetsp:Transcript_9640/g.23781  ORF Transcript_9640/g.23781 Transcript_9640/m.23781 type:complete len:122 (-) Transcript_9640:55-420(-)
MLPPGTGVPEHLRSDYIHAVPLKPPGNDKGYRQCKVCKDWVPKVEKAVRDGKGWRAYSHIFHYAKSKYCVYADNKSVGDSILDKIAEDRKRINFNNKQKRKENTRKEAAKKVALDRILNGG